MFVFRLKRFSFFFFWLLFKIYLFSWNECCSSKRFRYILGGWKLIQAVCQLLNKCILFYIQKFQCHFFDFMSVLLATGRVFISFEFIWFGGASLTSAAIENFQNQVNKIHNIPSFNKTDNSQSILCHRPCKMSSNRNYQQVFANRILPMVEFVVCHMVGFFEKQLVHYLVWVYVKRKKDKTPERKLKVLCVKLDYLCSWLPSVFALVYRSRISTISCFLLKIWGSCIVSRKLLLSE